MLEALETCRVPSPLGLSQEIRCPTVDTKRIVETAAGRTKRRHC